jgi:hypothetical protein
MIILAIFCNPISDLEFSFHLSQQSVGLLEVYTLRKKRLLSILILALGYKCWFQAWFFFTGYNWTLDNLMSRSAFTDLIFATLIIGSMRVIFNTCLRRLRRPLRLRSNKISDQDSGVIWTLERAPDGRICCGWTLAFLSRWRSIDENRRCGKSRPLGGQVRFSPDALGSKTQSRWDRASSEPQPRGAFLLPVFNRSWT